MADPKKSVPAAPKAPTTPPTKPEEAKKRTKVELKSTFESPEAAIDEAASRTKGPRRAFRVTYGTTTIFVVAHNEGRAGGLGFAAIGGKVEEIGRTKKVKALNVADIMAAIGALPADQQAAVKAQMGLK